MEKGKFKAIHTDFWLGAAVLVSQFRLSSQAGSATLTLPAFAQASTHWLLGADPAEPCSLNLG